MVVKALSQAIIQEFKGPTGSNVQSVNRQKGYKYGKFKLCHSLISQWRVCNVSFVVTHAVNEFAKLQRWDEIDKVIKENPSIASRIAEAGLKNDSSEEAMKTAFADQMGVDAVGFRKYMDYLSATVTISPLLGLLGTVTGMIGSFSILDSGAGASAITGGVGEALIATASGLCVAIMAFIVYTIFSHRLDSIINQIENMCVNIVTAKREGWKQL